MVHSFFDALKGVVYMNYSNSIIAVNGNYDFPCPSSMTWGKQDISKSSSGRSQYTGRMNKEKLVEKRKWTLQWNGVTKEKAHAILNTFKDEYFNVTVYDPLEGEITTKEYYCGDMTAPVYVWFKNNQAYQNVAFDIIER